MSGGPGVFDVVEVYEGREARERVEREARELVEMLASHVLPSEEERVRSALKRLGEKATPVDVVIHLRENGNLGALSEEQIARVMASQGTVS